MILQGVPKLRVRKSASDPDSLTGSKQSSHKFGGGRDDEAFAPAAILRTLRPRLQCAEGVEGASFPALYYAKHKFMAVPMARIAASTMFLSG